MNKLVEKFGREKRWVSWKPVEKDGRITKIPITRDGRPASSTDSSTWAMHSELVDVPKGIVFTPDHKLLGIDIDKCLTDNKITHDQKEQIAELILEADTYTEVSPSGQGLHLFLAIEDEYGLSLTSNRQAPFEAYTGGRYFTFTGIHYGEEREVRTVTKEEALKILSIIGYPWKEANAGSDSPQSTTEDHLSDEIIIKKMLKSKSKKDIQALLEGNTSKYKGDESLADAGLLSYLAFWTRKNPAQMERLWLSSKLGAREKTQKREDYRQRSIANALAKCTTVYEPPKQKNTSIITDEGEEFKFLTTVRYTDEGKQEIVIMNTENICRVLRHDKNFAGKFRYDIFRNTIEIYGKNVWRLQEMNDAINIQTRISILYPDFIKVGKDMVADAMMLVSKENIFDSAADFIKSLKWDGVARLDTWLCSTYGVPNDKYHVAVGSNWIKGLVKRIIEPGCKFDYVLVLEGEQGSMKSTSLNVLGGQWHVETTMSTDTKDFFMQFQGKAIIEFSEGETLSRTEVKRMKAIITTQVDKFRPPYERISQDFPRRCVFAMTTNQTEYLKDETGNRRWLPIKLEKEQADIVWLAQNREQLFAEAYHRLVELKESVHEFPKEETIQQQADRRVQDPNTERVCDWYMTSLSDDQRETGITISMAFDQVMNKGGAPRPIDRYNEMIISTIFKETLGLQKRRELKNGLRATRWYNINPLLLKAKDELDITTW